MEPVRGHRSKLVVEAARLHRAKERRRRGLTLVEGPDLIADVRAAGATIVRLFTLHDSDPDSVVVDERALARLSGTKSPRGPVAVVELPLEWLDRSRHLLVSVGVSDPGNVGTMIRTAAAFGWGFAYLEGSADPWSPKTVRAGAGGQFQTPVARLGTTGELAEWITVAAVPRRGRDPADIRADRLALLVGEESSGLPPEIVADADHTLTIPTSGPTESLNAAMAAGIAIYALSKHSGQTDSPV